MNMLYLHKLGWFRPQAEVTLMVSHIVAVHKFRRRVRKEGCLIGLSNGRFIRVVETFEDVNQKLSDIPARG